MDKKWTLYYLGAGASFESYPLNDNLISKINELNRNLKISLDGKVQLYNQKIIRVSNIKGIELFKGDMFNLMYELNLNNYSNLDEYAYSILENPKEINRIKRVISFYFEIGRYNKLNDKNIIQGFNLDRRLLDLIENKFFIKNNFKKDELKKDIKIITWNYDRIVEDIIYLKLKSLDFDLNDNDDKDLIEYLKIDPNHYRELFKIYPTCFGEIYDGLEDTLIVHLNGLIGSFKYTHQREKGIKNQNLLEYGLYDYINNCEDLQSQKFVNSDNFNEIFWERFSCAYINACNQDNLNTKENINDSATWISFFSERKEKYRFKDFELYLSPDLRKNIEIIKIIGYSFPESNREFDRLFFTGLNKNIKISIFNPEFTKDSICNNLDFLRDFNITIYNDCTSFIKD